LEFLSQISEPLDFVYIDTTHRYEDTKAELEASFKVVRPGGIIAGHDLNLEGAGVRRAVEEFCQEKELEFSEIRGDGLHSFVIILDIACEND